VKPGTRTNVSGRDALAAGQRGPVRARKRLRIAAVLCLVLLFPALASADPPQEPQNRKRVLVIYSAGRMMPSVAAFDEGIREALRADAPQGTRFYSEFWDVDRALKPAGERRWIDYLRWKYADRRIDLVVAVASPALEFMLRRGATVFPKVPVVFCLFGKNQGEIRALSSGYSGVLVPIDWDATLRAALDLQPHLRHVFVVTGTSDTERQIGRYARTAFEPYESQFDFTYLSQLKLSDLLARLGNLPPNSAIFWVSFSRDASGEILPSGEALEMAAKAANAPIYGAASTCLGHGIVGGRLLDFRKAGNGVGETAARVLKGESAPQITTLETAGFYGFDSRWLKTWGLSEHRLPAGSLLEYTQPGIWQRYKWEIVGVLGFALFEGLLIAGLLVERTHRKRTARALRKSENLKTSVLASLRNHLAVLDHDGTILAVNPAWEAFARNNGAGDKSKVGVGRNYIEVCRHAAQHHSPKAAEALAGIRGVLDGSLPFFEMEYACDSPEEERWFLMSVSPLLTNEGGAVVKHVDVSALRRAQAGQRRAEALTAEIVSTVHAIVWRRDADSDRFSFVSRQAESILGYPAELWTTRPNFWPEHIHPEDRDRALYAFHNGAKQGENFECEFRMMAADGRTIWMRDIVNVLSSGGRPRELTGLMIDVTERKETLSRLHESEERFRRMADTAPVLIWMSGVDKGCTYCNQPFLDFTGVALEQQLGNGWAKAVHPDDAPECWSTYSSAFDARRGFRMEYRMRRADGQYRWVLDTGVPRFGADGSFLGYIGSCIDISDRKQAEEDLLGLSGRLITVQEEERRYIARELHDDVSQRLALLSIELEQLSANPPASPAALQETVSRSLRQLSDISTDIHQLSYRLHPSKLDSLGLVAAVAAFCRELGKQKKIRIEFVDRNVPGVIPENLALCFYRVVQEALQNVVRHSGATEARVELAEVPGGLYLRVSDSGKGFDAHSPEVFVGLGMVSMKERVRLVGGHLEVDSRRGRGTSVEAWVPLTTAAGMEGRLRYHPGSAA
jgi:PAS domain S-box-containing protein